MGSSIAVFVHWDGKPNDTAVLKAANECVRYRCPDGAWIWADGPVGLAQADLATLPEDEPGVAVTSGNLRIVADCRVDNREEICQALPDDLCPVRNSDAAYILAAYRAWGEACLDRIIGDFAFVIWDHQQRTVFAARDLSGSRRLFYYTDSKRLLIASDHTQILQDPTVALDVDEAQIVEYLTPSYQWSSGWDLGMLRGLKALPAGFKLKATQGVVDVERYWHWTEDVFDERPESDLLEAYLEILTQALTCRLRSRGPIAFELSGGLDSTALVGLAARLANNGLPKFHTLSAIFDQVPDTDERYRINAMLDFLPAGVFTPHFMAADSVWLPSYLHRNWQPQSIGNPLDLNLPLAVDYLHDQAVSANCRIVITGEMGDAVNDGSPALYYDLLRRARIREAWRRLAIDWRQSKRGTLRQFVYTGLMPFAPRPMYQRFLLGRDQRVQAQEYPLPDFFTFDLREQILLKDRETQQQRISRRPVRSPAVNTLLEEILPPMVGLGVPCSQPLERRHPFTDRRLLEFSLSLPPEFKWEQEQIDYLAACRYHHRRAMKELLPDQVRLDNLGVDFSPAIAQSMTPKLVKQWLEADGTIHVFERGYVQARTFLDTIKAGRCEDITGYVSGTLALEAWLRALSPGGSMQRLIPHRQFNDSLSSNLF